MYCMYLVCTVLVYTLRRGRYRESVTPILRYSDRLTLRPSLSSVSVVPTVTHGKAKYRSQGETDLGGKRERERESSRQEANGASQPAQPASQTFLEFVPKFSITGIGHYYMFMYRLG